MVKNFLIFFVCLHLLPGCSSLLRNIALRSLSDTLYDASFELQTEIDWQTLKDSLPGMLKLLESIKSVRPGDKKLILALTKGYASYAFAISETLALEDILLEKRNSPTQKRALEHYSRAVHYGFEYLALRDISHKDLTHSLREPHGLASLLEERLDGHSPRDREAILYLGLGLGALIRLQKSTVSLLSQLPLVKELFDWVCGKDPHFNYGMCGIFYGTYESGIPTILGGNPERGKKFFLDVIHRFPHNYLARAAYIQYYAIPQNDAQTYREQKVVLERALAPMEEEKLWQPGREGHEAFREKPLRAFQAVGLERFKIIQKHEGRIF